MAYKPRPVYNGGLLLYKPPAITSHDLVARVRRHIKQQQVGHCGTLDPLAEGLMLVLCGEAVRLQQFLIEHSKTYEAEICFGCETDTCDREGSVIYRWPENSSAGGKKPPPKLDLSTAFLKKIIRKNFTGRIKQQPPLFSALKINGKRAYNLARAGEKNITMPERQITVYNFRILQAAGNRLRAEITCSAGTYIRSIARDIGRISGYYACLNRLKRTAIAKYKLADAVKVAQITSPRVIPPEQLLTNLQTVNIRQDDIQPLQNGNFFQWRKVLQRQQLTAFYYGQKLLLIISCRKNKCKTVYNELKYLNY